MQTIIVIVVFLAIFFVALRVGLKFSSQNKINQKRLDDISVDTEEGFMELQEDFNQEKSPFADRLERMMSGIGAGAEDDELALKLYRAGVTSPNGPIYYKFFTMFGWLLAIGVLVLFYLFAKSNPPLFWIVMAVGVFNAAMLTFGAKLWIKNSTDKRAKILVRSFPDTLDLLLVCVESGLALDAALARVCRELKFAHPEMTKELNRTRIELTMLNDREKALNNFSRRTDLIAVKSLVAALLQSEKFGTSLVETLRVLSDDYRNTRMMIAEEKAGKLPAKIAVSTLPLMLIALLMLIASPAIIKASQSLDSHKVGK